MKLEWTRAPVKTQWGHDMVEAAVEIDRDHTLSLYCEASQTLKVEALINRPWVGLTAEEEFELDQKYGYDFNVYIDQRDMKLKEKNT